MNLNSAFCEPGSLGKVPCLLKVNGKHMVRTYCAQFTEVDSNTVDGGVRLRGLMEIEG